MSKKPPVNVEIVPKHVAFDLGVDSGLSISNLQDTFHVTNALPADFKAGVALLGFGTNDFVKAKQEASHISHDAIASFAAHVAEAGKNFSIAGGDFVSDTLSIDDEPSLADSWDPAELMATLAMKDEIDTIHIERTGTEKRTVTMSFTVEFDLSNSAQAQLFEIVKKGI